MRCGAGVCGAAAGCYAGFLEQFEDRCPLTDVYSNGYRDKTTEKQRHREKNEIQPQRTQSSQRTRKSCFDFLITENFWCGLCAIT